MEKTCVCEANSKKINVFKLQLVQEIERGQLTVTEAAKKCIFKIEQLLSNG
jgi:hypothetical protein